MISFKSNIVRKMGASGIDGNGAIWVIELDEFGKARFGVFEGTWIHF